MDSSVVDDLVARLREQGLRATTPRRIIVETLIAQPGHITADGLTALVQARAPHVNKATVYRTLDALEALGEVQRTAVDQSPAHWHLTGHEHHHLVCDRCGAVLEVPAKEFLKLARAFRTAYGFEVDLRHIALPGVCRACAGD
jgi:Fur family transcriptional regulator, ferric uptake regulator